MRSHFYYLLSYLITYILAYFSASQGILRILFNPKFYYRSHTCRPPVPILSQLDPVRSPTSHFLKIHLNIIIHSKPGSPKWSLSFRFPHQKHLLSPIQTTCLAHLICVRFSDLNSTGWRYSLLSSSLCSFLHSPVTLSFLGTNIPFYNLRVVNILTNYVSYTWKIWYLICKIEMSFLAFAIFIAFSNIITLA